MRRALSLLAGDGALGLPHIGVLQWFEEQHIPVDYIAGTSMGGLVGGFYATGVSPAEMKDLIQKLDWDTILRDRTPYGPPRDAGNSHGRRSRRRRRECVT